MYLREVYGKSGENVNYRNSKLTLLLRDMFENLDTPTEEGVNQKEEKNNTKEEKTNTKEEKTETQEGKHSQEGKTVQEEKSTKEKLLPVADEASSTSASSLPPRRQRPRTVFIACFAPLDHHKLHSIATAKYCRQLRAIGSVRDGKRKATTEEMCEALVLYYLDVCPERATMESVQKTLKSFIGRERKLHGGLKKKYGRAPEALLRAPRPKGAAKSPLEWNRKDMRVWVKKTLATLPIPSSKNEDEDSASDGSGAAATDPSIAIAENEKVMALPSKFNVTGNQMYSFSVHDVIRRCGGGSSCAAFNSEEHGMYDNDEAKEKAEQEEMLEKLKEKKERSLLELCGRHLFNTFRKVVKADKKKN